MSICLFGGGKTILLQPLLISGSVFARVKAALASAAAGEPWRPGERVPAAVEGG